MQQANRQSASLATTGRTVTVVTPENITVTYQLAGVATRTAALVIDLIIQVILLILVRLVGDLVENIGFGVSHLVNFVYAIVFFCIVFVYNIFFELVWGGRTPGKRLFGLRVIVDGGYPITLTSSCIRNVLKFADLGLFPMPVGNGMIILFGAPGLLSVLFSASYKRIGDYAAGTVVIHESANTNLDSVSRTIERTDVTQFMPYVRNIDRVTRSDYRILSRFTARRGTLEPAVQAAVAESIARPLLLKLEMHVQLHYQVQYADVLEAIEARYIEENGLL